MRLFFIDNNIYKKIIYEFIDTETRRNVTFPPKKYEMKSQKI